jgi:hypothetical protein
MFRTEFIDQCGHDAAFTFGGADIDTFTVFCIAGAKEALQV